MNKDHVFVLDLDGTIYLENTIIDGAIEFIDTLKKHHRRFIFLTNNSSKNTEDYVEKLKRMGLDIEASHVLTSGEATRRTLQKDTSLKRLYLLGTSRLEHEFKTAGFELVTSPKESVDAVVLGFDTTLTYQKLWDACDLIREGVPYYATHPDFNCPLQGGKMMPDTGAMIAFIKAATGREPIVIGKPHKPVVDVLAERLGVTNDKMIMVGDRLYTDMTMAIEHGMTSVLVMSGETTTEMLEKSALKVEYVFPSVKAMIPLL